MELERTNNNALNQEQIRTITEDLNNFNRTNLELSKRAENLSRRDIIQVEKMKSINQ